MINSIFGSAGIQASETYAGNYLQIGNGINSPEKLCMVISASGIDNTGTFGIYVSNDLDLTTGEYGHLHTNITLGTNTYTGKWETDYPYKKLKTTWTPGDVSEGTVHAYLSGIKKEL